MFSIRPPISREGCKAYAVMMMGVVEGPLEDHLNDVDPTSCNAPL